MPKVESSTNIESGHETPFGIEDNVYVLDLWLPPSPTRGFWTAGMSHSSVEDSLFKNPVSPFRSADIRRFLRKKEDELEEMQEDELGNFDEDELEGKP